MIVNRIYNENCLSGLKKLADNSVDCCVTSPPYYGLRDYGTAEWIGGDKNCHHKEYLGGHGESSGKQLTSSETQMYNYKDICKKCGAIRIDNQIGLEETPEAYVQKLVEVFREVKRVLKPDGTLWLNLGDSYAGGGGASGHTSETKNLGAKTSEYGAVKSGGKTYGLKPKDLIGVPWMMVFALRNDGWWLRQDIIWHKPNPMPESVTDRCTKSHEYIFLLSKSRKYHYDLDSIKESCLTFDNSNRDRDNSKLNNTPGRTRMAGLKTNKYEKANKRSVWTVTTKPYNGAHFATFPEDLIIPCIKAGCPEQGIVLDPFMGAGTTALVALKLNRQYIGFELNKDYCTIAEKRLEPFKIQMNLFDNERFIR